MERTIANAALLSATVVVACLVVFPPLHLLAQNTAHIDPNVKLHRAIVSDVDVSHSLLTVEINGDSVPVRMNASSTVYLGNGEEATVESLSGGSNVYIFGSWNKEEYAIIADKIVLRNPRITSRTSLSKAEQERIGASSTFPTLETFGLSSR